MAEYLKYLYLMFLSKSRIPPVVVSREEEEFGYGKITLSAGCGRVSETVEFIFNKECGTGELRVCKNMKLNKVWELGSCEPVKFW